MWLCRVGRLRATTGWAVANRGFQCVKLCSSSISVPSTLTCEWRHGNEISQVFIGKCRNRRHADRQIKCLIIQKSSSTSQKTFPENYLITVNQENMRRVSQPKCQLFLRVKPSSVSRCGLPIVPVLPLTPRLVFKFATTLVLQGYLNSLGCVGTRFPLQLPRPVCGDVTHSLHCRSHTVSAQSDTANEHETKDTPVATANLSEME